MRVFSEDPWSTGAGLRVGKSGRRVLDAAPLMGVVLSVMAALAQVEPGTKRQRDTGWVAGRRRR